MYDNIKILWRKYKRLSVFLIVIILFLLVFLVVYKIIEDRNNIQTEEWVNVLDFSNILEMDKVGKLESYPITTILSDIDGEVMSINVVIGDIVQQYDILMQIKNVNKTSSDYDNIDQMMDVVYDNYRDLDREYSDFQREYGDRINSLEKELFNVQNSLIQAMELNDSEGREILEDEVEKINNELSVLKAQQEDLEIGVRNLESEMGLIRNETDKYYSELEKQTPRAPFKGVVSSIYVGEGDVVKNGDILLSIINNNYTPEISVNLDFNEYLLTKDLTGVNIIIENENWGDFEYDGEIYTRSPILNEEGKYTVTVKIIGDNVIDLILDDDNSKITVIFPIESTSEWIPNRCFKIIGKDNGVLTLRDGDVIVDREVGIKSIWENWINVDKLELYGLEKEEEIDGIELSFKDGNGGDQFLEVLCDIE